MSKASLPVIALVGPTATGKTALSIDLARELDGEVINADAMQFYPGLDIGTAKITPEETQGIVHHLIDILDLSEAASVSVFQTQSRSTIEEIRSREKTPIMTGGSGLYVRACLDQLEFPPTDPALREELTQQLKDQGREKFVAELQEVDPESAQRLSDDRRLIRALEVYRLTGRPFSAYMPRREYFPSVTPVIQIGLDIPRDELNQRIEERVDVMLEAGWLDEVRALEEQGLRDAPTAAKAIGYSQLLEVLDGSMDLDYARERIIITTRRFAKRQQTWFKADPRVHWIDALAPDVTEQALDIIQGQGDL